MSRHLNKKNRAKVVEYAHEHKCEAFELTVTARFVMDQKDIKQLKVVAGRWSNALNGLIFDSIKTKKYARLPGYVELTMLVSP